MTIEFKAGCVKPMLFATEPEFNPGIYLAAFCILVERLVLQDWSDTLDFDCIDWPVLFSISRDAFCRNHNKILLGPTRQVCLDGMVGIIKATSVFEFSVKAGLHEFHVLARLDLVDGITIRTNELFPVGRLGLDFTSLGVANVFDQRLRDRDF
jgi:hypothetical protein